MPRTPTPVRSLDDMPDLMTADEAAPFLRTTGRNVRRWIADGRLSDLVVQIGPRPLISREQLRRRTAAERTEGDA